MTNYLKYHPEDRAAFRRLVKFETELNNMEKILVEIEERFPPAAVFCEKAFHCISAIRPDIEAELRRVRFNA